MSVSLLSIVIFIQILFIEISSEDTFDCTGYDNDSFHPVYNSNNCRHYWHCIYVDTVYMRAVKRVCPAGTKFDIRINECEISSLVNCISPRISTSTKKPSRNQWIITKNPQESADIYLTTPRQFKVLTTNSSQLTPTFFIEKLLKKLIAINHKPAARTIESEISNTTIQTLQSSSNSIQTTRIHRFITSKLKRRHIGHYHRNNLTLNILTSNEHKIRQFSINQTHGLLIYCNELRRRHLRDLIFRTTTTHSLKIKNSSSKMFHYDIILSLTILLFLQK